MKSFGFIYILDTFCWYAIFISKTKTDIQNEAASADFGVDQLRLNITVPRVSAYTLFIYKNAGAG